MRTIFRPREGDMFGEKITEAFRSDPAPWRPRLPRISPAALLSVAVAFAFVVALASCGDPDGATPKATPAPAAAPVVQAAPSPEERRNACLYEAVVAYPEYVAAGGEHQRNGGKLLLDTLAVCDGVNKAKLRALMSAFVLAPIPDEG